MLEENTMNDFPGNEGGGVRIRAFGMGDDDITWLNFTEGRKVEQKEFATKQYLVTDSIRKQNWKLTGETKTILRLYMSAGHYYPVCKTHDDIDGQWCYEP